MGLQERAVEAATEAQFCVCVCVCGGGGFAAFWCVHGGATGRPHRLVMQSTIEINGRSRPRRISMRGDGVWQEACLCSPVDRVRGGGGRCRRRAVTSSVQQLNTSAVYQCTDTSSSRVARSLGLAPRACKDTAHVSWGTATVAQVAHTSGVPGCDGQGKRQVGVVPLCAEFLTSHNERALPRHVLTTVVTPELLHRTRRR